MKRNLHLAIILISILFSLCLQLLGLMHIVPLYISSPILFLSLLVFFIYMTDRKKFKGF
ncbi:hypothetical protein [Mesobacillus zeae]|uniref:hypothetical protein n=1 Tax=Mesobacillus zeae TaxID=1917180 RepID=UPI0015E77222|nr:hypothetical protein [Mesobacillus zeae]